MENLNPGGDTPHFVGAGFNPPLYRAFVPFVVNYPSSFLLRKRLAQQLGVFLDMIGEIGIHRHDAQILSQRGLLVR